MAALVATPPSHMRAKDLHALAARYHHDPAGLRTTDLAADLRRSLELLPPDVRTAPDLRVHYAHLSPLLPKREEILDELLPIALERAPRGSTGSVNLSTSTPVAFPDRPTLNVLVRVHQADGRLHAKIKIAVFTTREGEAYYEVGYVDPQKSLQRFADNFLHREPEVGDFQHLRALVDCTKRFIARRPALAGLDLTPAAFHVFSLCWVLGGRPLTAFSPSAFQAEFSAALTFTLTHHADRLTHPVKKLAQVSERWAISHLLRERQLFSPGSNSPLGWSPPRLVWPRPRSA